VVLQKCQARLHSVACVDGKRRHQAHRSKQASFCAVTLRRTMAYVGRANGTVFIFDHVEWLFEKLNNPVGLGMQGSVNKASDVQVWAQLATECNRAFPSRDVTGKQLNTLWYTLGRETTQNAMRWIPQDDAGRWALERICELLRRQPYLVHLLTHGGPVIVHTGSCGHSLAEQSRSSRKHKSL